LESCSSCSCGLRSFFRSFFFSLFVDFTSIILLFFTRVGRDPRSLARSGFSNSPPDNKRGRFANPSPPRLPKNPQHPPPNSPKHSGPRLFAFPALPSEDARCPRPSPHNPQLVILPLAPRFPPQTDCPHSFFSHPRTNSVRFPIRARVGLSYMGTLWKFLGPPDRS